jgi:tetratricopeptide (TPR) repeat protein
MGVSLYEEGDFPAALAEFERANEAAPSAVVLYNIAQTHLALRDYVAANDTLLRYIELGGDRITEARREEVRAQLATLAMRVGRILVACNEDGVAVIVDGHTVGRTPITEPLRVSSGRHQVVLRASGREPQEQNVTVAGNTEVSVEFTFDPLPPPVVVEEAPSRTLRTVGWIGMGVGIASGVTAFATFGLAMGARSDYDDATALRPANEQAARNARDDVRRFSLATDVLTGVAIAGCGAGLALILIDRNRNGDEESTPADTAVVVVPTRSGLNVVGRF